jgi:CRISPR-associated endonuclease/helicase Cas3
LNWTLFKTSHLPTSAAAKLACRKAALDQIARWLMRYGEHVRALRPATLREMMKGRLQKTSSLYERDSRMFDFRDCFKRLTGNDPFDWQERLFQKFLSSDLPDACDVPTGLGKTSVMTIWLIALGCLLKERDRKIPLRLVYVVDRRVIVDQATDEAEKLLDKLTQAISDTSSPLHSLAQTFRGASMKGNESLIALSTLRGQKADNREWCLDPSRPAIIIGTVDMIGSRLLFSGYGKVGINHRSLQAGLLGQDTLVVIDEAHLSPVFVSILLDIKRVIHQTPLLRPFHVISLSATLSGQGDVLAIDEKKECERNNEASLRLNAKKQIEWLPFDQLVKAKDAKKGASSKEINEAFAECLVQGIVKYETATEAEPARSVVVFAQTVDLVNIIYDQICEEMEKQVLKGREEEDVDKKEKANIRKAIEARILKMTGETRGYERDGKQLVQSEKFKAFLPERDRKTPRPTNYLIATSCAEVGVNLDADHGLCDLSTLDSMIQRIGRINRFGKTESTVTVVADENVLIETGKALSSLEKGRNDLQTEKAKKAFRKASLEFDKDVKVRRLTSKTVFHTWQALKAKVDESGRINASPLALRGLLTANQNAVPDIPVRPPFDEARLDDWAMTSLKQSEFPRPLVQYWLRGVIEDERAQTTFVWRADLDHFDFSNLSEEAVKEQLQQAEELATTIPIQPQERANIATYRAEKLLKELAKKFPDKPIVLIDPSGEEKGYAGEQLKEDKSLFAKLAFSIVVLPCSVGGLDEDGNPLEKLKDAKPVKDVVGDAWTRYLIVRHSSDKFSITQLGEKDAEESFHPSWQVALKATMNKGVCVNTRELQKAFVNEDEAVSYIACFFNRTFTDHFLREDVDDVASLGLQMRTVDEHDADVERYARNLAERIGLPDEIIELLAAAGFRHDLGKTREWWQKAIGNFTDTPYAKSSVNSFDHSFNQGYRHEFGSLIDSLNDESLKAHSHRDLILHLIAAHHGYARPHFPERAFDRNQPKPLNKQIAHETMLRFNRLQWQYGWWQLAYLEAILKAADAMASRDFSRGELVITHGFSVFSDRAKA